MDINKIEHFVVLMLENRAFDHVFGFRRGVNGLTGENGKVTSNTDSETGQVIDALSGAPYAIPTKHGKGPFHNLTDVNEQLFGDQNSDANAQPGMSGFVDSYREALQQDTHGEFTEADVSVVMKSFEPTQLPAINALADHFVLCDSWFSEVPGPTHPNRLFMHAGTSQGFVHNVFKRPFDTLTIYELLQRNNRTWAVYDFDLNEVKMFTRISDQAENFRRFSPSFAQDVETGTLPNYSFIIPRFVSTHHGASNDQHAPADVRWGEQLIADTYDVLRASDLIWNSCALIVTYDEHGGFFDHVKPPETVSPDGINSPRPDDNFHNLTPPSFSFDRLGVRVPALIVSPWVEKGVVESGPLQHTSILRTVRDRFGIKEALSERERNAPSLAHLFSQDKARTDTPDRLPRPQMPSLAAIDHHANPGNQWPNQLQSEMMDGLIHLTRPSHPEDDDSPPTMPTTQNELAVMAHRRWSRHHQWVKSLRK